MDDDGFLSVDALVALTLTTLGLVIVLQAYGGAVALNRRAMELRTNTALALWVLETQWPRLAKPGDMRGVAPDGRSWRVEARLAEQGGDHGLCEVQINVGVRKRVPYRVRTLDFCGTPT